MWKNKSESVIIVEAGLEAGLKSKDWSWSQRLSPAQGEILLIAEGAIMARVHGLNVGPWSGCG